MRNSLLEYLKSSKKQNIANSILGHKNLKLNNEDELMEFVLELCKHEKSYEELFKNIQLQYCTVGVINKFNNYVIEKCKSIPNFDPIYDCIKTKLLLDLTSYLTSHQSRYDDPNRMVSYCYNDSSPFNGIFKNMYEQNNVEFNASGINNGDVYDLLRNGVENDFQTTNLPNSYIEGQLKNGDIFLIEEYAIRGNKHSPQGNHHLKSWKLEGRRECDNKWIELDAHQNEPFDTLKIKHFKVHCDEELNAIRLTQTGINTHDTNHLVINAFDIFGKVYQKN